MEDGSKIKVFVIDQSAFARAALPRLIEADPQLEVCAVAKHEEAALEEIRVFGPDVILLTLDNGQSAAISFITQLMSTFPLPVVLLLPPRLSEEAHLMALEAGAVVGLHWDPDTTPSRLLAFQALLTSRLKSFGGAYQNGDESGLSEDSLSAAIPTEQSEEDTKEPQEGQSEPSSPIAQKGKDGRPRSPLDLDKSSGLITPKRRQETPVADITDPTRRAEVAVIGSGAGGHTLLRYLVTQLPENLNTAFLAIVRMPPHLVRPFAARLNRDSAIKISVAREGDPLRPGELLLAPTDNNMGMVRTGRFPKALVRLVKPEPGVTKLPSMDVTMRACSAIFGNTATGIVLSGLSKDGVDGLRVLRSRGGLSVVLDPSKTVVPSSNRMAIEANVADAVLSPLELITLMTRLGLKA